MCNYSPFVTACPPPNRGAGNGSDSLAFLWLLLLVSSCHSLLLFGSVSLSPQSSLFSLLIRIILSFKLSKHTITLFFFTMSSLSPFHFFLSLSLSSCPAKAIICFPASSFLFRSKYPTPPQLSHLVSSKGPSGVCHLQEISSGT